MDSYKRPRSPSTTPSSASSSSSPPSPTAKALRPSSPLPSRYACTLPPSCHETPTSFSSLDSLEAHHRNYHAFVCTAAPTTAEHAKGKGNARQRYSADGERMEDVCGRVFPDERILQLHLTECHDELAQLRSERGEKIFACFLPSCSQLSSTPKGRRLHLIDKHSFPSQYFFGVTIWGVEDVLKKGGGMVRRDWKPREGQPGWRGGEGSSRENSPPSPAGPQLQQLRASPPPPPPPPDIDDLATQLAGTSISLVPRSVRLAKAKQSKMSLEPPASSA
ncbi:hypothetical protein JCM10207_002414 [Rhodosporidiobolus poonsookiae]